MATEISNIIEFSTGAVLPPRRSVLLVDDQQAFRNIVRGQLARDHRFVIVGEAEGGTDAIRMTERLRPDVIVMDVQMPDMSGIEAARRILSQDPGVRIVLTSMGTDSEYEPLALEIGACGFVSKRDLSAATVRAMIEGFPPPADAAAMAA